MDSNWGPLSTQEMEEQRDIAWRLACEYCARLESGEVSGGMPMYAVRWWRERGLAESALLDPFGLWEETVSEAKNEAEKEPIVRRYDLCGRCGKPLSTEPVDCRMFQGHDHALIYKLWKQGKIELSNDPKLLDPPGFEIVREG